MKPHLAEADSMLCLADRDISVIISSLDTHCAALAGCRRCAGAGYFIGSTPISTLNAGAMFMTVGQAPGRHEAEATHLPFSGPAGRRLFRWLAEAGFDEAEFRATQAMVAITRCYPGPHPAGRGDRVPSRAEQALCAAWLEAELALIRPRVLIPIGGLAVARFLNSSSGIKASGGALGQSAQPAEAAIPGSRSFADGWRRRASSGQPAQDGARKSPAMTDLIGHRFERDGRIIVPLPHPSGASQWFNAPENKVRLARALEILAELREALQGL
jgi:uracil-DNA glycosylase